MLVAFCLSVPGVWLDSRVITGAPVWMKPAKFAISSAIYAGTMAWLLGYVEVSPRLMRSAGNVIAWVLVLEVALIDIQAARGTTSHFNVATPLDFVLFGVMGVSILILWMASVAVMVGVFRQKFHDRAWGWTLRLAMLITVLGTLAGGLMVRPTPEHASGGHTVGAADGGPGLPAVGWSRDHGDLRIPHFMGMHAIQVLPLLFCMVRRRSVALVWSCAGSYVALFGILLWQALRGQSILRPDGTTLWAVGIWLVAAVLALLVVSFGSSQVLNYRRCGLKDCAE